MRMDMPYEAEWIIEKIRSRGFEAFAVGGCVRDTLLSRTPGDWDITTSAKPEEVKSIFGKTVDTGLQHGTVTIIKNHKGYEVTTYRIDGEYLDGRHPETVEFTANLLEDLKRRDFTINAMAYSHETGIVDAFDGMNDLENRVVRCVGRAHDRFTEDALRILRAVRFAAQLDFSIEEETYRAISDIAPNLSHVSKERIQVELTKLLLSGCPEKIAMVAETGIGKYVTDGFMDVFSSESNWGCVQTGGRVPEQEHLADRFASLKTLPSEKSLRWAGFLRRRTPEQAVKILKGLKLDNETVGNAKNMIAAAQSSLAPEKPAIRRVLSRITPYQFEGALLLKELDGDVQVKEIRKLWGEIEADGDCVSLKTLAVNGGDLMEIGIGSGKVVGDTLALMLSWVLDEPGLNEKELLLSKLNVTTKALNS